MVNDDEGFKKKTIIESIVCCIIVSKLRLIFSYLSGGYFLTREKRYPSY